LSCGQCREECQNRKKERASEQFVECASQFDPLVHDHKDGGPTTQTPAANAAAPLDVRFFRYEYRRPACEDQSLRTFAAHWSFRASTQGCCRSVNLIESES
jgi:hypothetical protein